MAVKVSDEPSEGTTLEGALYVCTCAGRAVGNTRAPPNDNPALVLTRHHAVVCKSLHVTVVVVRVDAARMAARWAAIVFALLLRPVHDAL
jgi:hypothetical protein